MKKLIVGLCLLASLAGLSSPGFAYSGSSFNYYYEPPCNYYVPNCNFIPLSYYSSQVRTYPRLSYYSQPVNHFSHGRHDRNRGNSPVNLRIRF